MKRIVSLILVAIMLIACVPCSMLTASAAEETEVVKSSNVGGTIVDSGVLKRNSNISWKLYDDGTLVVSGKGEMIFKDSSESPWVTLYDDSRDYEVTRAIINDGITNIGFAAFYYCRNLTSITIPDSVTSIGGCAFDHCESLTSITIPDSVTSIGRSAFCGCTSLTRINIPDGVTSIGESAFYDCSSLTSINIPDGVTSIGDYMFRGCSSLTSIIIPDGVPSFGRSAFALCNSLTSIAIPNSVTSIGENAFSGCTSLATVYYVGTDSQWRSMIYVWGNDCLRSVNVIYLDEDDIQNNGNSDFQEEFIQQHLNYIDSFEYNNLLNNCDLASIALSDYGKLKDDMDMWRIIRGKLFDNPYQIILADMIISEDSVNSQLESYSLNLYKSQRTIINSVVDLIDGDINLTKENKNRIQKLFETKDYSDSETYNLCKKALSGFVKEDELLKIFQSYDTFNKFAGLLGDGENVVESVINVINYCAVLDAYQNTSVEFQIVLMQIHNYCSLENPNLAVAIEEYLNINDEDDVRDAILMRVASEGLDTGVKIFGDSIEKNVISFLLNNMDLGDLPTAIASKLLSFVQGIKIGYDVGTTINNILFNTDACADSYVEAYAAANFSRYLKMALEHNEEILNRDKSIKYVSLFCQTFGMYKKSQILVADKMIKWQSINQQSLASKITGVEFLYESNSYQWLMAKVAWNLAKCHNEDVASVGYKAFTVACPTNVVLYDANGDVALEVKDNKITTEQKCVEAIIRNGVKYIIAPNNEMYNIIVQATDDGSMSYSVARYTDTLEKVDELVYYDITISEGESLSAKIDANSELSVDRFALVRDNGEKEENGILINEDSIVSVESITASESSLELEVGDTQKITYNVMPENATQQLVTWYASDSNIATINEYGVVKALSVGETVLTVMTLDGEVKTNIVVNVIDGNSKFEGASLTLGGNIGVNFAFDISDDVIADENAKVVFTLPDGSKKSVPVSSVAPDADGNYVFTCEVAAKEMTKTITAQVVTSDDKSEVFEYSVLEYADYILTEAEAGNETYTAAAPLVKAMLNYGAYAQEYFGYNTANLANDILEDADKALPEDIDLSEYSYKLEDNDDNISYYGSALSLNSETSIKHYFIVNNDAEIPAFYVNGEEVKAVKKGNRYEVKIEDIPAHCLGNKYVVTAGGLSLDYNVLCYANLVLKSDNENLKDAMTALYAYNIATKEYIAQQ